MAEIHPRLKVSAEQHSRGPSQDALEPSMGVSRKEFRSSVREDAER